MKYGRVYGLLRVMCHVVWYSELSGVIRVRSDQVFPSSAEIRTIFAQLP